MGNMDWYMVLESVDRDEERARRKFAEKQKQIEELFKNDKTVSQVLKGLRGLNDVTPMALGEVLKSYGPNFSPLEELADGWTFVISKETKNRNSSIYLLQRNDENMGYVVDLDSIGLC